MNIRENKTMKQIRTVLAVFMIAGTVAALIMTALRQFLPALGMIACCALAFAFFLFTDRDEQKTTGETDPHNTEYMRYCSSCGYLASQLSGERVPPCPRCGGKLFASNMSLAEFRLLPEAKRKECINKWKAGKHR